MQEPTDPSVLHSDERAFESFWGLARGVARPEALSVDAFAAFWSAKEVAPAPAAAEPVEIVKPAEVKPAEKVKPELVVVEDAAPNVRRAYGEDALQALSLALEAIRIDLRDSGRQLSWLGNEPGLTGFHRVPYALGLQLVEKLESMIDAETEKYAQECIAGLHSASR